MSRLGAVLQRSGPLENPSTPLTAASLASILGIGVPTSSGQVVTPDSAQRVIAVAACQRLIAETIATLDSGVYDTIDGKVVRQRDPHWLTAPNPDIDFLDLVEDLIYGPLGDGNAYAQLTWKAGAVWELYPQAPNNVRPHRDTSRPGKPVVYDFYGDGSATTWDAADVMHIRAFRRTGQLKGMSPIEKARQGIGLALATEQFGAEFFGNGATASAMIESPNDLSRDQARVLLDTVMRSHTGSGNAHKPGVLSNGAHWNQISISPDDAQFLETQQFSVAQIARLYRVPPHLISDVERSTSWGSGLEEQNLMFVTLTLRPWIVRLERAFTSILRASGQATAFFRFNVDSLLRGRIEDRFKAYAVGRQWGWYSANDVLRKENEEPIAGGDTYLSPLNMISAAEAGVRAQIYRDQGAYYLAQAGFPPEVINVLKELGVEPAELLQALDAYSERQPKPVVPIDPNELPKLPEDELDDPTTQPEGGA